VDTAVGPGTRVPPDYDPLIAKLMVVDETREAAIDRLARAIDETTISGIQTTLPFHRFIAADPAFRAADLSVAWVDEHWGAIADEQRRAALDGAVPIAGAAAAASGSGGRPAPTESSSGRSNSTGVAGPRDSAGSSAWARAGRVSASERWPR
jgi:acetyl/propionyl-CoA carboxylase alpha subunit